MARPIGDIDFGPAWAASGTRGFFGEGYWFHPLTALCGNSLNGTTFVAKTATAYSNEGNMELGAKRYTPAHRFPSCVWADPLRGIALNAVGLSNPGIDVLVRDGLWQSLREPLMLSFMPVGTTPMVRMQETLYFSRVVRPHLHEFYKRGEVFALQHNVSCPNTGHDQQGLLEEAMDILGALREIGIPVVVKVCAATPAEALFKLCNAADGVTVSNTVPFGDLKTVFPDIDWGSIFPNGSPLLGRTGVNGTPITAPGELSGKPLLPLTAKWVRDLRNLGYTKHINAGRGILRPSDVDLLHAAGADSISIASVVMLRGWVPFLVPRIIRRAEKLFGT